MEPTAKYKLRENFHQAKWDEPIIFELHTPGERGVLVPEAEPEVAEAVGDGLSVNADAVMVVFPEPASFTSISKVTTSLAVARIA